MGDVLIANGVPVGYTRGGRRRPRLHAPPFVHTGALEAEPGSTAEVLGFDPADEIEPSGSSGGCRRSGDRRS